MPNEQELTSQITETETEARQAVRKKGMPRVLAISTAIAAVVLALLLIGFISGF